MPDPAASPAPPVPATPAGAGDPRFAQNAAAASIVLPLAAFMLTLLTRGAPGDSPAMSLAVSLFCSLLLVLGVSCAGLALAAIPRFGQQGLRVKAIVGLVLLLATTVFLLLYHPVRPPRPPAAPSVAPASTAPTTTTPA